MVMSADGDELQASVPTKFNADGAAAQHRMPSV